MTTLSINRLFELTNAIESFLAKQKNSLLHSEIQTAYLHLKAKYADLKISDTSIEEPLLSNDAQRVAYLLTRMPATYSVARTVFHKLTSILTHVNIHSLLDLGTGTGSILWAAINACLNLQTVTALDQDAKIIELAKQLAQYSTDPFWQHVQWLQKNITTHLEIKPHDLVMMSYALIEQANFIPLLDKMWHLSNKVIIIIEPGTPKGFANIHLARDYFIKKGGYIAAPCSHQGTCPIKNPNWCHFAERIERSAWQRSFKGGTLGYEDEPYSYLIVTKFPFQNSGQRILSPPARRSGHVILNLCAPDDIEKRTVTRSQKADYKISKKKKWGDVWI